MSETAAAAAIADGALRYVQDEAGRVRVEDYLTCLGAVTGEATLLASGVLDVEQTDMAPGSAVFGDPINVVLSGDKAELEDAPSESVVGVLVRALVPSVFAIEVFPSLKSVYEHVAKSVGNAPWGEVATSVPDENKPTVVPLRAAFEMRPLVDAAYESGNVELSRRHIPCAMALATALEQTRQAIDPSVAVKLALEVTFGMAKVVPMSRAALEAAQK